MKKTLVLALAGILASGFVAMADPAGAAEYDRYERGTAAPPPPPRGAPPLRAGRPGSTRAVPVREHRHLRTERLLRILLRYVWTGGYSSGLSGNVGFGSRVSPFGAIEGTVGTSRPNADPTRRRRSR